MSTNVPHRIRSCFVGRFVGIVNSFDGSRVGSITWRHNSTETGSANEQPNADAKWAPPLPRPPLLTETVANFTPV